MYQYNQQCRPPHYRSNYEFSPESESDMEYEDGNMEFNYEMENDYEMAPGFEINDENESDMEYGSEREDEAVGNSDEYRDEMEVRLEYVTNEEEFSNWVNEIVTHDHRSPRPAMGHPLTQRAVRQFSRIAAGALPYLGRRAGGWKGVTVTVPTRFGRSSWQRPGPWRPYGQYRRPHHWRPPYTYSGPFQQPPYPNPLQQPAYSGFDPSAPQSPADTPTPSLPAQQSNDQDGSFKNFVLDTLKGLSRQIALGNDSMAALKNSIVSSAAGNFPAIVQPKQDSTTSAPPESPTPPTSGEFSDHESGISEEMEMDLAADLLNVRTDKELDHFLGNLLKSTVGAVTGILNSPQGKILKGIIGTVAKKALPIAGAAAGTYFGGPLGASLGQKLGQAASGLFEMELEGLSNEDREFEVARAIVRFGTQAARQVSDNHTGNPAEDVRQGVLAAAAGYAPGLLAKTTKDLN